MKPCNESEIVGLKSMQPSKDYYKGYDAAENNYIRIIDKIRAEIEEYKSRQLSLAIGIDDLEIGKQTALEYVITVLDKYKAESEDAYGI